jgi:hypothetical protein
MADLTRIDPTHNINLVLCRRGHADAVRQMGGAARMGAPKVKNGSEPKMAARYGVDQKEGCGR